MLDIEIPWDSCDGSGYCFTKTGMWDVYYSAEGGWIIAIYTSLSVNPSWLSGILLAVKKPIGYNDWQLSDISCSNCTADRKLVCQWWEQSYGVSSMSSDVQTICANLGVQ